MSVAIQYSKPACHKACPDMPFHSLNAEQKAKGLVNLQNVRHTLKEKQLEPLHEQRAELVAKANNENTSALERARINQEIKRIDSNAQRITERWS